MIRCQHCDRDIRVAMVDEHGDPLYWEDENGITVCKKRIGDEPFLTHQPMPAVTP